MLHFREKILQASCKPLKASHSWQKALDYIEFKEEKKIVTDQPENTEIMPDELATMVTMRLKENKKYKRLLKEFFLRSFNVTQNIEWKLRKSWASFVLTSQRSGRRDQRDSKDYLLAHVKTILEKSRISSVPMNRLIFAELKKISYPGIEFEPTYVYALAETSFRARLYTQSRALINGLANQGLTRARGQLKQVKRLQFMLQLLGY